MRSRGQDPIDLNMEHYSLNAKQKLGLGSNPGI